MKFQIKDTVYIDTDKPFRTIKLKEVGQLWYIDENTIDEEIITGKNMDDIISKLSPYIIINHINIVAAIQELKSFKKELAQHIILADLTCLDERLQELIQLETNKYDISNTLRENIEKYAEKTADGIVLDISQSNLCDYHFRCDIYMFSHINGLIPTKYDTGKLIAENTKECIVITPKEILFFEKNYKGW